MELCLCCFLSGDSPEAIRSEAFIAQDTSSGVLWTLHLQWGEEDFSFFLSEQHLVGDFAVVWIAAGVGYRLYFQSQRKSWR